MSGVAIVLDEVTPLLARVSTAAQAKGLALVGGRAVGQLVRDYLVDLNSDRHRCGRNYYAQAARSVNVSAVPSGAAVSITQIGFRQRLLGGTILPKKQFLTIPAIPEAVGTLASEWTGLKVAFAYDPKLGCLRRALVRATPVAQVTLTGKGKLLKKHLNPVATGEAVFWLVRRAVQNPDPSVLPYAEQMTSRAVDAISAEVQTLLRRGASTGGEN